MKILIISQYFHPENFRINDLAIELKKRGHEITVLTGKPNYPQGDYFDGYSFKGNEDELWNNIKIVRTPLRARKSGAINLIRNYYSFVYHASKKVKKIDGDFDVIYVFEVSPMTVALPAIKLKKTRGIPIVMNVQDLWPENVQAITGINNWFVNCFLNKLVNYIYINTDLILTASPAFNEMIVQKINNSSKVKYWPQYSTVCRSFNADKIKRFNNSDFNIVFTGNIGEAQGLDIILDAAMHLIDTEIVFHFIGDGRKKKELEKIVQINNLENKIIFHGQVLENEIPNYLFYADMALLVLRPNPVFDMTIPAKLQTYLACACPILGCVQGVSKKIIDENYLGITAKTNKVEDFVDACKRALLEKEKMGFYSRNALEYSNRCFNKLNLICELEKSMEEIINDKV